VTNLPPGTYRIEVEKLGFKVVIKSDLILHVQDALEIILKWCWVLPQRAYGTGRSAAVWIPNLRGGQRVERRKVNELPLNGRTCLT